MKSVETLEPDDLLFLPNLPREEVDKLIEGHRVITSLTPLALIPPYDPKSENNTALMAMNIKLWYPERTVGIVMPMVIPARICQLVRTFRSGGFSPIVFINGLHLHVISRLKNHLHKDQWYHVCDPEFVIPFEGVRGKWTRSDKI